MLQILDTVNWNWLLQHLGKWNAKALNTNCKRSRFSVFPLNQNGLLKLELSRVAKPCSCWSAPRIWNSRWVQHQKSTVLRLPFRPDKTEFELKKSLCPRPVHKVQSEATILGAWSAASVDKNDHMHEHGRKLVIEGLSWYLHVHVKAKSEDQFLECRPQASICIYM